MPAARASCSSSPTGSARAAPLRAPPTWSLSRWLSTSRSMRVSPRARSSGTKHALAGVASRRSAGRRRRAAAVRARAHQHRVALADVGRQSSNCPRAAARRRPAAAAAAAAGQQRAARHGSGSDQQHARRAGRQAAPRRRRRHRPDGAAASAASHCSSAHQRLHEPRPPAPTAAAPATPSSASGVTTSVTQGIATRLASKPTSETCWKNTSVSGVSAERRDHLRAQPPRSASRARRTSRRAPARCALRPASARRHQHAHRHERQPEARPAAAPRGRAPPPAPPASSTSGHGQRSPSACSSATVASIQHRALRRHAPAGEAARRPWRGQQPAPARRLRRRQPQHRARAAPPQRADHQAGEPGEHRDVQAADAIRCATPVSRNRSQSARSIAAWSPTASAASTPAQRAVGHAHTDRHRARAWRARSIGRCQRVVEQCRPCAGQRVAHRAGGTNALLEQPQLVVETMRIQRAVRAPQPHRQLPALAGTQVGPQRRHRTIVGKPVQPHQRDALGDRRRGLAIERALDREARSARPRATPAASGPRCPPAAGRGLRAPVQAAHRRAAPRAAQWRRTQARTVPGTANRVRFGRIEAHSTSGSASATNAA